MRIQTGETRASTLTTAEARSWPWPGQGCYQPDGAGDTSNEIYRLTALTAGWSRRLWGAMWYYSVTQSIWTRSRIREATWTNRRGRPRRCPGDETDPEGLGVRD